VRQLRPVDSYSREHPEVVVPHVDQTWWLLSRYDSALVSSADGTRAAWYQRDPKRFRSLVQRNMALHARLMREWPALSRRYRAAIPELASVDRWRETFEAARREGP
jgi:galactofuranosylgalactofuranosylrhamnosyl-N-acetylglucosaminyl-diphospho-decaprenol beta-1,5/1,6-galactofuranosyltransferase